MSTLSPAENRAYEWMARHGVPLMRISIGVVFFWFGIQKFFPGVSSAEDLASRTIAVMSFGLMQPAVSMPLLAAWEVFLGVTFITGKLLRFAIPLLFLQMIGTVTPLFFFPDETFNQAPFLPNLVGQYIIKNLVLVSGAMIVGAYYNGIDIRRS
jgi:uncharacterized membrane protein YkgB